MPMQRTKIVVGLVERIKPILSGQSPDIQGATLADLLSIWLAGHRIEGDAAATQQLHETLLEFHIESVRELIPVSAAQIRRGMQ